MIHLQNGRNTSSVWQSEQCREVLRNESGEVLRARARLFRVLETMFKILDYLLNAVNFNAFEVFT